MYCPKCYRQIPDDSKFCANCGANVSRPTCIKCGAALSPSDTRCKRCGLAVSKFVAPREKTVDWTWGGNAQNTSGDESSQTQSHKTVDDLNGSSWSNGRNANSWQQGDFNNPVIWVLIGIFILLLILVSVSTSSNEPRMSDDPKPTPIETIATTEPTIESGSYDPDDRFIYIYYAHKFVRDKLSSPMTAIFASYGDHEVTGKDNLICVKGHVNAQNKLGVFIKNNFTVQFTIEDGYYHCTYMKIGSSTFGTYVTIE